MNIENKTIIKLDDGREIILTEVEARQLMNKLNFIFNNEKSWYPYWYPNIPWTTTYKTYTTDSADSYKLNPITISGNVFDHKNTSGYITTDELF
jgi:hypothetical protein